MWGIVAVIGLCVTIGIVFIVSYLNAGDSSAEYTYSVTDDDYDDCDNDYSSDIDYSSSEESSKVGDKIELESGRELRYSGGKWTDSDGDEWRMDNGRIPSPYDTESSILDYWSCVEYDD